MIAEIVTFQLRDGMNRSEVVSLYEKSVPVWREAPHLVHKSFLYDEESRTGGGVYLWETLDAARAAHGPAFQERIRTVFGSTPEFRYFESPVVISRHVEAAGAPAT